MTRLGICMTLVALLGGCSLFKSAPPPAAPEPERDNTVTPWFQVVPRRADVAAYPAGREHVLAVPATDRQFVVVRVLNYPKVKPLLPPTFVPAVPAPKAVDPAAGKPVVRAPQEVLSEVQLVLRFPTDGARLTPEAKQKLDQMATDLGSTLAASEIRVEGHTDSIGSAAHNERLSLPRANSVRDYLVVKGAQSSRVTVVGMGERAPVATNDTEAGRAANRRALVHSKSPAN